MFAFAEGLLDDLNIDSCVIDVGGFGVNVNIPARTAAECILILRSERTGSVCTASPIGMSFICLRS